MFYSTEKLNILKTCKNNFACLFVIIYVLCLSNNKEQGIR